MFEEKFFGISSSSPLPDSSSHLPLGRVPSTASFAPSSTEILDSSFDSRSVRSSDSRSSLAGREMSASSSADDLAWKARSRVGTVGSSEYGGAEGRATMASSMMTGSTGASTRPKDTHWFESKINYAGIPLPIRIPVATFEEEIGDVRLDSRLPLLSLTRLPCAVLAHQPHPDLLPFSFLFVPRRVRSSSSSPSYFRPFDTPYHPPLQRSSHSQASRVPRPWSASGQGRRVGPRCLRARQRLWSRAWRIRRASIPVHQPLEPRQPAGSVSYRGSLGFTRAP